MKIEDVKIGMRVVPFQKTVATSGGFDFNFWLKVRGGEAILKKDGYVTIENKFGGKCGGYFYFNGITGAFSASDFSPYTETKKQGFSGYFQGNKTVVFVDKKQGEANYNPTDETPYNPPIGLLYAYCRATGTDTSIMDLLFKKPVENTSIRDEVIRLVKSELFISAIKYYKEKTDNDLRDSKTYVDKIRDELKPTEPKEDKSTFKVGDRVRDMDYTNGINHGDGTVSSLHRGKPDEIRVRYDSDVTRSFSNKKSWFIKIPQ